jgi:DNA-binding Lrp family transcriptional regulator
LVEAYVLINVGFGSEEKVLSAVKNIPGVKEVYVSYGVYDLIVKVVSDSADEMREIVTRRLRTIDNIVSTLTLTIV